MIEDQKGLAGYIKGLSVSFVAADASLITNKALRVVDEFGTPSKIEKVVGSTLIGSLELFAPSTARWLVKDITSGPFEWPYHPLIMAPRIGLGLVEDIATTIGALALSNNIAEAVVLRLAANAATHISHDGIRAGVSAIERGMGKVRNKFTGQFVQNHTLPVI